MSRNPQILTVFVASPSDVGDERVKLEEVVSELNVTWSRELDVLLELIAWETHTYPSMGKDAQDVINKQIPDDFDLFIGIVWSRFGTPTSRAGSGTEEEFRRAKERYNKDNDSVDIMMYFKDEALPPSQIDISQLDKVNSFRNELGGEEGGLYWNFKDLSEFEKLVRMHLARQVQKIKNRIPKQELSDSTTSDSSEEKFELDGDDDVGILDLFENFEDNFDLINKIIARITDASFELSARFTEVTEEIGTYRQQSSGNVDRKATRRLVSKISNDMVQYSTRVNAEVSLFGDAMNTGMDSFVKATTMYANLPADDVEIGQLHETLDSMQKLFLMLRDADSSVISFRDMIKSFPPLTSDLNIAKREVVSAIDGLSDQLRNGQNLLREAESSLIAWISQREEES